MAEQEIGINGFSLGKPIIQSGILFMVLLWATIPCLGTEELDLTRFSLEELMDIEVTSVAKKSQSLSDSAAAIFVITKEDLRQSGVTNIPDALRMVPGMNVARLDSNKWAINCRGFNGRFSPHLLVMIDGRSVYTPSFSGVYWEVQDVLLEDVEQIEVIRGPGAALWGANAVNGVINIITRSAKNTKGGVVSLGSGDIEKAMAQFRYGDDLGEDTAWRIYGKTHDKAAFDKLSGTRANDDWNMAQAGFRMDSNLTKRDHLTLQGDLYSGKINQDLYLINATSVQFPYYMDTYPVKTHVAGKNILSRWAHSLSDASDFALKLYYDATSRTEDIVNQKRDSFDIDFQHRFQAGSRNEIIWGTRYHWTRDDFSSPSFIGPKVIDIDPAKRQDHLYSLFVQDEIRLLKNRLNLTLGTKFEHNAYSGFEVQPSARIMWKPNGANRLWASVSRAVRTPSRAEHDANVNYLSFDSSMAGGPMGTPLIVGINSNKNLKPEELIAYETGYRFMPSPRFSMDAALFFNDYENLRAGETAGTPISKITNQGTAQNYGLELALGYRFSDFFTCSLAYGHMEDHIRHNAPEGGTANQASIRGVFTLPEIMELNIWLRYVDETRATYVLSPNGWYEVNDYLTMDLRLGWQISPELEFSLVGQNLFQDRHLEFVQEGFSRPVEVPRAFYGKLSYRF